MLRAYHTNRTGMIEPGRRIAAGAEGKIFEVSDRPDLVAKLYHQSLTPEKAEKLEMLARLGTERLYRISAWPVDVLRDELEGKVIGFIMKRILDAEEVHSLHSPSSRLQKFPEASWAFLIFVAANIARAVAAVHDHQLVVGDLNPKNILVTKQATVYLLDCDSYQVTAEGRTWRCEMGFPEYTPPELQGAAFKDFDRVQDHDYFGLAVVIFQLLFIGRHPFSGRFQGEGEMPLSLAIGQRRFAFGRDALARQMQPPPATLPLEHVPAKLAELFRRAFLAISSADRPAPREWIAPLESLAQSLTLCALHNGHHYFKELTECPWCLIESLARIRVFNFALAGPNGKRPAFHLDEIWKEIEQIQAPAPRPPEPAFDLSTTVSPGAQVLAKKRTQRQYLAMLFSLVTGFCAGLVGELNIAIWSVIFLGTMARKIAEAELFVGPRFQSLQLLKPHIPDDPRFRALYLAKLKTERDLQELEQRWQKEAGIEPFLNKLQELKAKRDEYERLPDLRLERLKRVEATVKNEQRQQYLNRHALEDLELGGIWPTRKDSLQMQGIETAADVNAHRLNQVPGLGKMHANKLLEWRSNLERQFVFDPLHTRAQQGRIVIEKEIDALAHRLQHELGSGPFYLRRTQQEIEENRKEIESLLNAAREQLARTEHDFNLASKQNPAWPIFSLLIAAVLLGLFVSIQYLSKK